MFSSTDPNFGVGQDSGQFLPFMGKLISNGTDSRLTSASRLCKRFLDFGTTTFHW